MLQTLKRFIAKSIKKSARDGDNEDVDTDPNENPKFMVSTRSILRLLGEVEKTSPLCTITLSDNSQYSSSILGINADQHSLTLDELLPRSGNQLIDIQSPVKVTTSHKGIHLSFQLKNLKIGEERGIAYFTAPLPERIYYPQRRTTPRVTIDSQNIAFSGYHEASQQTVTGIVYDLSRNGIGIEIPKHRARLQPGDVLTRCRINVASFPLEFTVNIRFVKPIATNSGKNQIGGYLKNLDSRSEHKLSHFIASLERMELRKQKAQ